MPELLQKTFQVSVEESANGHSRLHRIWPDERDSENLIWALRTWVKVLGTHHPLIPPPQAGFRSLWISVSSIRSLASKVFLNLFYVYECLVYINICAPCVCLISTEVRRGCQVSWDWGYNCK